MDVLKGAKEMPIISFNTNVTGLVGQNVNPRRNTMITTDSLSDITAAGYLNNQNSFGAGPILPTDIFEVLYDFDEQSQVGTFGIFQVSYSSATGFSLNIWENPGNVLLPVVANNFAVFSGTSGQIKDLGFSATDASKTKVVMLNSAPAALNLASYSNVNGTLGDSGILPADVQLKANIKAARTANIGGAGAGPISVAVTGLTANSIVVADIQASTNAVEVQKVTATGSGFDILFSGDPGATCTVNYVAFIAAQ